MLYIGLPLKSIWKLQLVQNAAMRVVSSARYITHLTSLLCELHWLVMGFQVQFKMLAVTFKALHDLGLGYLRDCLFPKVSTHPTQSNRMGRFRQPKNGAWWDLEERLFPQWPLLCGWSFLQRLERHQSCYPFIRL